MDTKPTYELMKRNAVCRVCNKQLQREVHKAVKWYSYLNQGMKIIICPACIKELNNIVEQQEVVNNE